jgi:hypothetical protein
MYRRLSSLRISGHSEGEADWTVCFTPHGAGFMFRYSSDSRKAMLIVR